jgi:GTP:adenosylcobinamide-phosphate guanylyltransferase
MLGDQVLPMIRSGNWTINIDTPEDLELAQKIEVIGK